MTENKKKLSTPLVITIALAGLILVAYLILKIGGGSIYERSETLKITDNPAQSGGEERAKRKLEKKEEEAVEIVLKQIADQFSKGEANFNIGLKKEKSVLTDDEKLFLEEVKKRKEANTTNDSVDWFNALRSAHKTYQGVKSIFENAGIDVSEAEKVSTSLAGEVAANTIFSKMEEIFDIPQKESRAFAKKGEQAISDWARFVEEERQ